MSTKLLLTAVFTLLILILAACTSSNQPEATAESGGVQILASGTVVPPTAKPIRVDLPDMGAAPEILNDTWVNTDEPVTLASVQGKVVLLEFWTFG